MVIRVLYMVKISENIVFHLPMGDTRLMKSTMFGMMARVHSMLIPRWTFFSTLLICYDKANLEMEWPSHRPKVFMVSLLLGQLCLEELFMVHV